MRSNPLRPSCGPETRHCLLDLLKQFARPLSFGSELTSRLPQLRSSRAGALNQLALTDYVIMRRWFYDARHDGCLCQEQELYPAPEPHSIGRS
jgi:hypothetical protein